MSWFTRSEEDGVLNNNMQRYIELQSQCTELRNNMQRIHTNLILREQELEKSRELSKSLIENSERLQQTIRLLNTENDYLRRAIETIDRVSIVYHNATEVREVEP